MELRKRRWARIARLSVVALGAAVALFGTCGSSLPSTPNLPWFSASPTMGPPPLVVQFSAAEALAYEWDFTNDGAIDATTRTPTHTYVNPGIYTVRLVLTVSYQGAMVRVTQTKMGCVWVLLSGGSSQGGTQQGPGQQQNPPTQQGAVSTIYWGNIGDNTIRMAQSTGGMYGKSIVVAQSPPYVDKPTGIQFADGFIVWANYGNNTIYAKQVGSSSLPILVADKDDGVDKPSGLCIVDGKILYWVNQVSGRFSVIAIGDSEATVVAGLGGAPHFTGDVFGIDVAGGYLYWADARHNWIRRVRLADPKTVSVGTGETLASRVDSGVDQPGAIRVVGNYVYWANGGDNTIRRCSLKGPFPAKSEKLAGPQVSKVNVPTGIVVLGNMIGWANYGNNTFHACTIGGSPCQSTLLGTNASSQIDGPGFIWVESGS